MNIIAEPYLATISKNGFHRIVPDDPKLKPFAAIDVGRNKFLRDAEFQTNSSICKDGVSWWTSGMQKTIVDIVYIITDDPESLFVIFCVQNCEKHPKFLGKLVDDHNFTREYKKVFSRFFQGLLR